MQEEFKKFAELNLEPGMTRTPVKDSPFSILTTLTASNEKRMFAVENKQIGEGQFGKVFIATDIKTGKEYVAKGQSISDEARNEARVLGKLEQLEGMHEPTQPEKKILWIVMPKVAGQDLKKFTDEVNRGERRFSQSSADAVLLDIAEKTSAQLQDIHKKGVLHCDINPCNIMYDEKEMTARFIDFATGVDGPAQKAAARGARAFIDPQIAAELTAFEKSKEDKAPKDVMFDEKREVYALGKTLAFVAGLTKPSKDNFQSPLELMDDKDAPHGKMLTQPALKSELLTAFRWMTNPDPQQRPTIAEAAAKLKTINVQFQNRSTYQALPDTEKMLANAVALDNFLKTIKSPEKSATPPSVSKSSVVQRATPEEKFFEVAQRMSSTLNDKLCDLAFNLCTPEEFKGKFKFIVDKHSSMFDALQVKDEKILAQLKGMKAALGDFASLVVNDQKAMQAVLKKDLVNTIETTYGTGRASTIQAKR